MSNHERTLEGVGNDSVANLITICFRPGAEAGVKIRRHFFDRAHAHVLRKLRVEGTHEGRGVVITSEMNTRDLTERVDTGVGTSCAVDGDGRALESGERILEETLHGIAFGLPLPADETRTVVREGEFEITHGRSA